MCAHTNVSFWFPHVGIAAIAYMLHTFKIMICLLFYLRRQDDSSGDNRAPSSLSSLCLLARSLPFFYPAWEIWLSLWFLTSDIFLLIWWQDFETHIHQQANIHSIYICTWLCVCDICCFITIFYYCCFYDFLIFGNTNIC